MYCTVNDIRLYYEVRGAGTPLILLHGNGEDHRIFAPAAAALSERFTVYTPDSRCHGLSSDPEELDYDLMADDLIGFIRALGLEKPLFYGFSDGGIIGLLAAMKEPQLLGKLIVSGANLEPRGLCSRELESIHAMALAGDRLCRLMDNQRPIPPENLRRITVPTVVLAGEYDLIRPEHTRLIADSIPGAVLEIIPGEDHSSYIVNSSKLSPILSRYL